MKKPFSVEEYRQAEVERITELLAGIDRIWILDTIYEFVIGMTKKGGAE